MADNAGMLSRKRALDDKVGILLIHLILVCIPMVCELAVGKHRNLPRPTARIGYAGASIQTAPTRGQSTKPR